MADDNEDNEDAGREPISATILPFASGSASDIKKRFAELSQSPEMLLGFSEHAGLDVGDFRAFHTAMMKLTDAHFELLCRQTLSLESKFVAHYKVSGEMYDLQRVERDMKAFFTEAAKKKEEATLQ